MGLFRRKRKSLETTEGNFNTNSINYDVINNIANKSKIDDRLARTARVDDNFKDLNPIGDIYDNITNKVSNFVRSIDNGTLFKRNEKFLEEGRRNKERKQIEKQLQYKRLKAKNNKTN